MKKKIVYVCMAGDILHEGHINIFKKANKLGNVVVGLLTDKAITSYKKNPPIFTFEQRKTIIQNIKYVDRVVTQTTLDYVKNLNLYRPDYVVHGDDWRKGVQKKIRERVIKTLMKWSGELIEPKYTKKVSSTIIKNRVIEIISIGQNKKIKLKKLKT